MNLSRCPKEADVGGREHNAIPKQFLVNRRCGSRDRKGEESPGDAGITFSDNYLRCLQEET